MAQQRLADLLAQPDRLSMPISALLVKGSFATGLAGPHSDLDLWVVAGQQANPPVRSESSPVILAKRLRSYLEEWIPNALEYNPPVELDLVVHDSFRGRCTRAARVLRLDSSPGWSGIEAAHEIATSRWVVGSAASFMTGRVPTRDALAQKISILCYQSACRTFNLAEALFDQEERLGREAERLLVEAVEQLCSAVLAAHGYDNPKAKWRLRQATLLDDNLGKMVESALRCCATARDHGELTKWFQELDNCLSSGDSDNRDRLG